MEAGQEAGCHQCPAEVAYSCHCLGKLSSLDMLTCQGPRSWYSMEREEPEGTVLAAELRLRSKRVLLEGREEGRGNPDVRLAHRL